MKKIMAQLKAFHNACKNMVRQEFLYVSECGNWPGVFGKQFGNL